MRFMYWFCFVLGTYLNLEREARAGFMRKSNWKCMFDDGCLLDAVPARLQGKMVDLQELLWTTSMRTNLQELLWTFKEIRKIWKCEERCFWQLAGWLADWLAGWVGGWLWWIFWKVGAAFSKPFCLLNSFKKIKKISRCEGRCFWQLAGWLAGWLAGMHFLENRRGVFQSILLIKFL